MYQLDWLCYIIAWQEGALNKDTGKIDYTILEYASPRAGIGILQWSNSRSFDLIHDIYVKNGNSWGDSNPPSDIKNAIETNSRWGMYDFGSSNQTINFLNVFLSSENSISIQNEKVRKECQHYLDVCSSKGITDKKAQLFVSDFINQYGEYTPYINDNGGHDLDWCFQNDPQTYYTRRKTIRDFVSGINLDEKPPETDLGNPNNAFIPSGDPTPTVTEKVDDPVFQENDKLNNLSSGNLYKNNDDSFSFKKGVKLTKTFNNTYNLRVDKKYLSSDLKDMQETAKEEITKEEENKVEDLKPVVENSDSSVLVDTANSFADNSLVYDMEGARNPEAGSCDCSSFVLYCLHKSSNSYPLQGFTGTIVQTFQAMGKIIYRGGDNGQAAEICKKGDIIVMGQVNAESAGGSAHTGIMINDTTMRHQSYYAYHNTVQGMGPDNNDISDYLSMLKIYNSYQDFVVCRP